MGLLALILFAVCFGFWYAKHDYQEIVTGYIINHSRGFRIRISVLLSAIPYDQNEANKEAANNTEIRILNPLEWLIMYPVTIS